MSGPEHAPLHVKTNRAGEMLLLPVQQQASEAQQPQHSPNTCRSRSGCPASRYSVGSAARTGRQLGVQAGGVALGKDGLRVHR